MILKFLISFLILTMPLCAQIPWVAYGTVSLPPFDYVDNPTCNSNGVLGEIPLPFVVPPDHNLIIIYIHVEGISFNKKTKSKKKSRDFGIKLWLGELYQNKSQEIFSCSSLGESVECRGMYLIVPEGKVVNIRCVNGASSTRVNSFFIQGILDKY